MLDLLKRGQLFSVDFLIAVGVLTLVLGLWLNSFSAIQRNSFETVGNASSFAIASDYFNQIYSGTDPVSLGCSVSGSEIVCDACVGGSEKVFTRRLVSYQGAKLLRVGVCP